MTTDSHDTQLKSLLRDMGWVKSLARSLVRDASDADDLAQDALLAAVQHDGGKEMLTRGWFVRVLTNRRRTLAIREDRRRRREQVGSRPEALPSAEELARRMESQHLLSAAVMNLAEPYRSTVILRYSEGLMAAEIADRQDTAQGTVRSRLKRALEMLRAELDESFEGGREAWSVALMPLAFPAGASSVANSSLFAGGALILSKALAGMLVAVLVVSVWLFWDTTSSTSPVEQGSGAWGGETAVAPRAGDLEPVGRRGVDLEGEAPASSARVALGEEGDGAAGASAVLEDGSKEAILVIHARDRDTGSPIPDVRVSLWSLNDEDGWGNSDVEGSVGAIGSAPITDINGRAEFRLPRGVEVLLASIPENNGRVKPIADLHIPALESGERIEVTLEFHVGYDRRFFGRVFEAGGEVPVPGAEVRFYELGWMVGAPHITHATALTDSNGLFQVLIPTWVVGLDGRVDAPGFGPVLIRPSAGHEEPGSALLIGLVESARLIGSVSIEHGSLVDQFTVHVQASGTALFANPGPEHWAENPSWTTDVLAGGAWAIAGLPPNTPLTVDLRGPGDELRRHQDDLVLEPGEERVLDWGLGAGATLRGRAVFADTGEPCGGQAIWLVLGGTRLHPDFYRTFLQTYWEPTRETRTDDMGVFVFTDLDAGRWHVGPAPQEENDDQSVAPLAEAVEVDADGEDMDLLLNVHRGLYIRGIVKNPDGERAVNSYITGEQPAVLVDARGDEHGVFTLGPLAPGEYSIQARDSNGEHVASDSVMVVAGVEGLVLGLKLGGAVSGRVVDSGSGAGLPTELMILKEDGEYQMPESCGESGEFEFNALPPGSYRILANTELQAGLVRSIHVSAGDKIEGVKIALKTGAHLGIRYDGQADYIDFEILTDGALIASGWVNQGVLQEQVCFPAGEVTVRFIGGSEAEPVVLGERTVNLVAGEKVQAVWPMPEDDE